MIDEKKAIEILKNAAWLGSNEDREQTEEAVKMAVEAIDKQISKEWRLIRLDYFKKYKVVCPVCNSEYTGNYDSYDEPSDFEYCPCCGHKMEINIENAWFEKGDTDASK